MWRYQASHGRRAFAGCLCCVAHSLSACSLVTMLTDDDAQSKPSPGSPPFPLCGSKGQRAPAQTFERMRNCPGRSQLMPLPKPQDEQADDLGLPLGAPSSRGLLSAAWTDANHPETPWLPASPPPTISSCCCCCSHEPVSRPKIAATYGLDRWTDSQRGRGRETSEERRGEIPPLLQVSPQISQGKAQDAERFHCD
jgi:hypothetical protein